MFHDIFLRHARNWPTSLGFPFYLFITVASPTSRDFTTSCANYCGPFVLLITHLKQIIDWISWQWLPYSLTWCHGPELSNPFWRGFQTEFWHGYPKNNNKKHVNRGKLQCKKKKLIKAAITQFPFKVKLHCRNHYQLLDFYLLFEHEV